MFKFDQDVLLTNISWFISVQPQNLCTAMKDLSIVYASGVFKIFSSKIRMFAQFFDRIVLT